MAAAAVVASLLAVSTPVVPTFTQHRIAQRAPAVAYVPARLVVGWRYRDWKVRGGVLRIRFASRTEPRKTIVFTAQRFRGDCRAGGERSFQLAGVKVWYAHTPTLQRAWRCAAGVRVTASTAMPPSRFAGVGLGRIAASGHRVR